MTLFPSAIPLNLSLPIRIPMLPYSIVCSHCNFVKYMCVSWLKTSFEFLSCPTAILTVFFNSISFLFYISTCYSFYIFTSIKVTVSLSHTFSDLYFIEWSSLFLVYSEESLKSFWSPGLSSLMYPPKSDPFFSPTNMKLTENSLLTRILIISNMSLVFNPTEFLISVPWLNNSSQPPVASLHRDSSLEGTTSSILLEPEQHLSSLLSSSSPN